MRIITAVRTSLLVLMFLVMARGAAHAQVDSTYIAPFSQKVGIQLYSAQKMLVLNHTQRIDGTDFDRTYQPNNPVTLGVGLSLYNTIISVGLGVGLRTRDKNVYGKTKNFDFQLHNYGRKFAFDLYVQHYDGFFSDDDDVVELYPGMKVRRYALQGQYIFNHRKFSYNATLGQNERQLRSVGSWLIGGQLNQMSIDSDTGLRDNMGRKSDSYQIGINGGYGHTWAFRKYYNITFTITGGIALGYETFEQKSGLVTVSPTASPRFSFSYDRGGWALGVSYVGDFVAFDMKKEEESLSVISGIGKFSFIKRFR